MATNLKKHKFNVIDAILIIVILAVITVAALFFVFQNGGMNGAKDKLNKKDVVIEYEVLFTGIKNEIRDVILREFEKGDKLDEVNVENGIGEIVDVRVEDATFIGNDMSDTSIAEDEGKLVLTKYPDHSDITFVVRTKATLSDSENDSGRYSLNDEYYDFSIGTAMNVKTPYFTGLGYCIGLHEVTEDAKGAK